MNSQLTGYERQQQTIIDQMNQSKAPLEEIKLPSKKGFTIVRRRVTEKESFGWGCERAKIIHNKQTVAVYRRDEQSYWSLDMSVVL